MTNKPLTTRGPCARAALTLLAIVLLAHRAAAAADLEVAVLDPAGKGVAGVVIVAETAVSVLDKHAARTAVMDQRNMQFVPNILVVQTGTGVSFPNSDQIRHQVYSFSPAKAFQLSLYAGSSSPRVIFDHPGLVTVGIPAWAWAWARRAAEASDGITLAGEPSGRLAQRLFDLPVRDQ